MVEHGNFIEQYRVMSARERNATFRALIGAMPSPEVDIPLGAYDLIDEMNADPTLIDTLKEELHPEPLTKEEGLVYLMNLIILGDEERRRRRAGSEHKKLFMTRVQDLSQFAHTTRALWEVVVDELSGDFDRGVDQEHLLDWFTDRSLGYPILLDPLYQNGGVFSEDRNEVKEVERKYYHHSINRWRKQAQEEEERERFIDELLEDIRKDPRLQAREQELEETLHAEREAKERGEIPLSADDVISDLLERREQEQKLLNYVDSDQFRQKWHDEFVQKYGEEP